MANLLFSSIIILSKSQRLIVLGKKCCAGCIIILDFSIQRSKELCDQDGVKVF